MAIRVFVLIGAIASLFTICNTAAVCFNPDGTVNLGQIPCNGTIPDSGCCDSMDACTTGGACLGRLGVPYRGSCTDRTWGSSNCGQFCFSDPVTSKPYGTFTAALSCGSGVFSDDYCCESVGKNCCEIATFKYGNTGFAFVPGMDLLLQKIATVTVTATAESSAQTNSNGSKSASVSKADSTSSNLGPAIGLGIGLPLGILVIGILTFLFWRERKHSRADADARLKVLEMDPGLKPYIQEPSDQRNYYVPGLSPKPRGPSPKNITGGLPGSKLTPIVPPPEKSPAFAQPTGVHELI